MIPVHWSETKRIQNLDDLLRRYKEVGGSIVEYKRVWSLLLVSKLDPCVEWVPPGGSRVRSGLKHTLFSILLGWWSFAGFFWTIGAIIQNLMGGVDVTEIVTAKPGQPIPAAALRAVERQGKIQQYSFLLVLFVVLGLLVTLLVIPQINELH